MSDEYQRVMTAMDRSAGLRFVFREVPFPISKMRFDAQLATPMHNPTHLCVNLFFAVGHIGLEHLVINLFSVLVLWKLSLSMVCVCFLVVSR